MKKDNNEWKKQLSDEQYKVLRESATEAPFSGHLLNNKETGNYVCAGCGTELFSSETKFDSGSGWPSFYEASSNENIELKTDQSHGMIRNEVLCSTCGGHLGHLFDDGPSDKTGQRFCINSVALDFKDDKEA